MRRHCETAQSCVRGPILVLVLLGISIGGCFGTLSPGVSSARDQPADESAAPQEKTTDDDGDVSALRFDEILRALAAALAGDPRKNDATARWLKTLFIVFAAMGGAAAAEMLAAARNPLNSIAFWQDVFRGRSPRYYRILDFSTKVIVGGAVTMALIHPSEPGQALMSGFGWSGALSAFLKHSVPNGDPSTDANAGAANDED